MKRLLALGVLMIGLVLAGGMHAQVVVVNKPNRPAKVLVKPTKARKGYVWVDGHWRWSKRNNCYVWKKGQWVRVKRGHRYIPGQWKKVPKGWKWVPGHWKRV